MKRISTNILSILVLGSLVIITSCSEKDPLPQSVSGFEVQGIDQLEKHIPVQFINNSTNAETYIWDFGDETGDSTNISPSHTYTEAGEYIVTLTAVTKDGQTSSESKSIKILTRYLTAFTVNNIRFVNDENLPWDDDGTGPDLVFYLAAQSATDIEDIILTDTIPDLTPEDLPLIWEFSSSNEFEFTNELYDLFLIDDDPEKAEDPKYDILMGVEFNPVQYAFTGKFEDNTGYLQISTSDGVAVDLYVSFSLQ